MLIPAVFALPDAEHEPCELCGESAIVAYLGKEKVVICDCCREYFKRGFGVSVKEVG